MEPLIGCLSDADHTTNESPTLRLPDERDSSDQDEISVSHTDEYVTLYLLLKDTE